MKRALWITATTLLLAACSGNPPPVPNPAIEDFIVANQLESVDRVRTRERDGWVALNNRFVIWNNRRPFLIY